MNWNAPNTYLQYPFKNLRVCSNESTAVEHYLLLQHGLYDVVRLDRVVHDRPDLCGRHRLVEHGLQVTDHADGQLFAVHEDSRYERADAVHGVVQQAAAIADCHPAVHVARIMVQVLQVVFH